MILKEHGKKIVEMLASFLKFNLNLMLQKLKEFPNQMINGIEIILVQLDKNYFLHFPHFLNFIHLHIFVFLYCAAQHLQQQHLQQQQKRIFKCIFVPDETN